MKKFIPTLCIALALQACGGSATKPAETSTTGTPATTTPPATQAAPEIPADIQAKLDKYTCLTCHKVDEKLIGPAYKDVAQKGYANEQIVNLIYNPQPENWPGYPPMLAQKEVPQDDALAIAQWINSLK